MGTIRSRLDSNVNELITAVKRSELNNNAGMKKLVIDISAIKCRYRSALIGRNIAGAKKMITRKK